MTYEYTGDISSLYQNLPTTGIKKNNGLESNINLHQNPVDKSVMAEISNSYIGSIRLQILSIDGKTITTSEIVKSNNSISTKLSTSNLPNGIYLVKFQFGEAIEAKKIVIK